MVISGDQWCSVVLSCDQWSSVLISASPRRGAGALKVGSLLAEEGPLASSVAEASAGGGEDKPLPVALNPTDEAQEAAEGRALEESASKKRRTSLASELKGRLGKGGEGRERMDE